MNQRIIKGIILSVLVFLAPQLVLAAPRVSGVSNALSDGNSITINGSSFGVHPDYETSKPQLNWEWNQFENGLTQGGWNYGVPSYEMSHWKIETSGARSPGGRWAKRYGNGDVQGLRRKISMVPTDTFFMSYWSYVPLVAVDGKTIRITWNTLNNPNGHSYFFTNLNSKNYSMFSVWPSEPKQQRVVWGGLSSYQRGVWLRTDYLYTGNGTNPKSQKIFILGKNNNNPLIDRTDSGMKIQGPLDINIGAGHKDPTNNPDIFYGYDDVYINFTQARVELCNSSTWLARTSCEIQIPTAWSTNSITVKTNKGAFKTGDRAYLYIVDANGAVSNGLPITIGSGGSTTNPTPDPTPTDPTPTEDTTPPSAPTGLRVQ